MTARTKWEHELAFYRSVIEKAKAMKHHKIRLDTIWCWIDEQAEQIEVLKEEWQHSESIHQSLFAQTNLLRKLGDFLRELEIEMDLEDSQDN